jgi:hypothetical protein
MFHDTSWLLDIDDQTAPVSRCSAASIPAILAKLYAKIGSHPCDL